MGLLSGLRRRRRPAITQAASIPVPPLAAPPSPVPAAGGFVVVDVETTGLVAGRDRVIEIAAVWLDPAGRVVDEWTTLINPGGPVGATRIHGITAADVRAAPRFADIVGELTARLAGRALVAHNALFDLAFIRAEFARAGWQLPAVPYLCTLEASFTYLPQLSRRRLADCCWANGIQLQNAHSALGDARATAMLLAAYLDHHVGRLPRTEDLMLPTLAAHIVWPDVPRLSVRVTRRVDRVEAESPAPPGTLWTLLDALPLSTVVEEGAPTAATTYLELLFEVLEDGILTEDEAQSLAEVARVYSLTRQQVEATHRGFLLALAHRIVEDGKVTRDERAVLHGAARSLGFSGDLPSRVLDDARAAFLESRGKECRPLPETWSHGAPLRVGQAVAFTGCDQLVRAGLEGRAQAAGLRVTGSVSRKTAALVTDGANPHTTKGVSARAHATRVVAPEAFAVLVDFIQPANAAPVAATQPLPVAAMATDPNSLTELPEEPAVIRAWARESGLAVGVRGRVRTDLLAAYRAAHETPMDP